MNDDKQKIIDWFNGFTPKTQEGIIKTALLSCDDTPEGEAASKRMKGWPYGTENRALKIARWHLKGELA